MADTDTVNYTGGYGGYYHSGFYRQVWLILTQWLIHAGMADTSTVAYLIIYYLFDGSRSDDSLN